MSETLGNFLVDLATNTELAARFLDNPEAELARTPLTPDERAAILARDSRRISLALGASLHAAGQGITTKKKKKGSKKKKIPRKPASKKR